ncbi:glucokinase [Pseudodesulfovibrio sp. F-1]|uniref:Glucokinase n=1 Tax=Pseudodesulfovibrio alkaliphilus TaxID=2661613 RepID=A0A7K1KPX9_9BACT|nr:glucokinase [Pseudodesulfovibrio alkaliphilus]MUM78148.1 glucokinase [Pseudodesulfovibrio alkaliphilus]
MVRILAADIGGTHSRFAVFKAVSGVLDMGEARWLASREATSFAHLIDQLRESGFALDSGFDAAVLAVAGPVVDGTRCRLPNVPWDLDLGDVELGADRACLINDFAAQAQACRSRVMDHARILQPGQANPDGVVGIIGAGTGLGHAALIPDRGRWIALASEAGHMAFPFTGSDEAEFEAFVRRETGRGCAEADVVVSGPGLRLLHAHLTGQWLSPADISAVITPESPTARWFARFYGRACRNWALAVMSRGGLVIGGGVAARNALFVTIPEFLDEFRSCSTHADFLCTLPVRLNADDRSGLYGAAIHGVQWLADEGVPIAPCL